jgi:hypothetical protein
MQQKKFFAVIGIIISITVLALIVQRCKTTKKAPTGNATVITWNDLYEFDYKTGKAPQKLLDLDKKKVRIAGYVVPLADEYFVLSEFLLVPNAQACIHVPPPPPNLIIYVKLDEPLPIEKVYNPAWIEGTFTIEPSNSVQGSASFKLSDATLDEYKD